MLDSGLLSDLVLGGLAVLIGPILQARSTTTQDRTALLVAAFHPVAALTLFYSLAAHMHHRLGGWPERLGTNGFPDDLATHADLAYHAFGSMLLGGILVWPCAFLVCAGVPALRNGLRPLVVYGIASVVAFAAMSLAPEPFLDWWWD